MNKKIKRRKSMTVIKSHQVNIKVTEAMYKELKREQKRLKMTKTVTALLIEGWELYRKHLFEQSLTVEERDPWAFQDDIL